jgi:exopolyphosphatase/guanosine-5'-triphosphate,3'-diphosphate pyrophosphatase
VHADFRTKAPGTLVCIDIGGGSTELIFGDAQTGDIQFRKSLEVGSVRLTERYVRHDPPRPEEIEQLTGVLDAQLAALPRPAPGARVIGVAGTVTTLFAVEHGIHPYDAAKVQGGHLSLGALEGQRRRLCGMTVAERRQVPGLQPKRADVMCAGALILERALHHLGAAECTVSDRGLRWGLLTHKFGTADTHP